MSRHFKFGIKLARGLFIILIVLMGYFVMPALASSRFVDHGNGTISDTKTGLMWAVKDNGGLINWRGSVSFVGTLVPTPQLGDMHPLEPLQGMLGMCEDAEQMS